MSQHPNAKPTPRARETLVSRIESGLGVAEAARQMGISRQTASKRLRRSRSGEPMSARSSRPRRLARSTPHEVEERVAAVRRELMLAPLGLAVATGVPARTCARIVARRGTPGLADIDRVTVEVRRRGPAAPVRYERERPGGWSTRTSRRSRGSRTAAAASLAPSRCPTRRRAPERCSWAARRVSARGWAWPSSA